MRIGDRAPIQMRAQIMPDPFVEELFARNEAVKKPWVKAEVSSHIWTARLPADLPAARIASPSRRRRWSGLAPCRRTPTSPKEVDLIWPPPSCPALCRESVAPSASVRVGLVRSSAMTWIASTWLAGTSPHGGAGRAQHHNTQAGGLQPLPQNTRLCRMSSASIVISASRSISSFAAKQRLACRSRARSSALRIERALAKCGWPRRIGMYSASAWRAAGSACSAASPASPRRWRATRRPDSRGSRCDGRRVNGSRGSIGRTCPSCRHNRRDDDEVVPVVLHHLQQDFDRFLAIVALVFRPIEIVGLVDEQHAAHRPLEHLLGLGRGMADVLTNEVVARHRDEMAAPDIAELVQHPGIVIATVVLPVPGLPVKLMCRVGLCGRGRALRARSTSNSAAISRMRCLTGARPISSSSSCASTGPTPDAWYSVGEIDFSSRRRRVVHTVALSFGTVERIRAGRVVCLRPLPSPRSSRNPPRSSAG